MVVIVVWVALLSTLYFLLMKCVKLLRVSFFEEVIGLDIAEMGERIIPPKPAINI